MRTITPDQFNQLIALAHIRPGLTRELHFIARTSGMSAQDWQETELMSIPTRSGNKGVLLLAPNKDMYILAYDLTKGLANRQTGRAQPIICDFCRTWQSGSGAASISFAKNRRSLDSVSFLCCADLACSQHVRSKTQASRASRAQLRENLTNEQRVGRLKKQILRIIADLDLSPITTT